MSAKKHSISEGIGDTLRFRFQAIFSKSTTGFFLNSLFDLVVWGFYQKMASQPSDAYVPPFAFRLALFADSLQLL